MSAAAPSHAETQLSPSEFEAMTTGKTLQFNRQNDWYGAEQYLPDQQVIWQYGDGSCTQGRWFADDGALCFTYDDNPLPQCWIFTERDGQFFARPEEDPAQSDSELRLSGESDAPLSCKAPNLSAVLAP